MIMSYDTIVEIANEIINNSKIPTENLVMVYQLPSKKLLKLNEDLFYHINGPNALFEPSDFIEVEVGGINFRFETEKKPEENLPEQ